ncbi:acetyltransferase [Massilia sp. G4R7]|uniref:Acetyltransferase n=1 Tax=Massilia phyllostachyos TaxID=2898585 RepID=A0ABS8QCU4_9BURK|nr:acetyltransferase [Massilia phyllostachyos]MCD2519582.1 acetyltransferase [Massilia phyllostachyos]
MPTIRSSTPADATALADIWRASVRATHDFLSEAHFAEIEALVAGHYLPHAPLWVVEADGCPAGFMGLTGAHVDALFIDPRRRAQGLGRAMIAHAEAQAGKLTVDVNEQNPQAVGFYERMGFMRTGRSAVDDAGRPYPLLHMRQP